MIRISVNTGGEAKIHEFETVEEALDFIQLMALVIHHPSPFSFTWEDVKPCQHDWRLFEFLEDDDSFVFTCYHKCPDSRVVTQAQITESAKA